MNLSSAPSVRDLFDTLFYISYFVDSYRDDLDDSCDWVRHHTGYTYYDGFCLVEDGDSNYDFDCYTLQEYQRDLQVRSNTCTYAA